MSDAPKNVVFLNRFYAPDQSATAQILADLSETLVEEGFTVKIVTSRLSGADEYKNTLQPYEKRNGVEVFRVRTTSLGERALIGRAFDYLSFYVIAFNRLLSVVQKGDILVCKTDPPMICLVAYFVAKLRGARLVNWIQDLFPEVAHGLGIRVPLMGRIFRFPRNAVFRRSVANVTIGEQMRQRVIGFTNDRPVTELIENWVVADIEPVSRNNNQLLQEWGLADKFVVGYSGNIGRAHELQTVLDAAELLQQRKDIVFLFVGAGPQFRMIEQKAYPNVVVKPYQPHARLSESLSCASVHLISLLPKMEGLILPSKLYGILAVGKPIINIGSTTGEISTLVRRHVLGRVVEVGQAELLAEYISTLAEQPAMLETFASNAHTYYLKSCAYGRSHARWAGLLNRLTE